MAARWSLLVMSKLHVWRYVRMSRESSHQWYLKNKELTKARAKASYEENKQLVIDRTAKWAKDNPDRRKSIAKKYDDRYAEENPLKIVARNAVNNALRDGRIEKTPCECGETEVEAHHEDYNHPLNVDWMCIKCHKKLHRKVVLN
jgi:hypothetical protein